MTTKNVATIPTDDAGFANATTGKPPANEVGSPLTTSERSHLDAKKLFINRELSWLQFNRRVLEEALDAQNPLLERVRFLAIFASNLDEFFMIRVSGLRRQLAAGALSAPPDGMSPVQQLAAIRDQLRPVQEQSIRCWQEDLQGKLQQAKIEVLTCEELKRKQRKLMRAYFRREIFPVLTPLAFDPGHPFPHISNLSINLAVVLNEPDHGQRFARVRVPTTLPRLLRVPSEETADTYDLRGLEKQVSGHFVWLETVVAANLDLLFPGLEILAVYPFRVIRDADFAIEEDEASDLLTALEEGVGQRHFGLVVRLEVDERMPERIRDILLTNLGLAPYQVDTVRGPLGMAALAELARLERPELKFPPFLPILPTSLSRGEDLFAVLRRRNVLLYHPYDSFNPVIDFIRTAARDPEVLAIKQTLYRVGPDSPIVEALKAARENGKQVAVLVELKARFDETNNIVWARALEHAGVHVVYGVVGLKTHAKICLVVRREPEGIRLYAHLGTGNYNPVTARAYSDLGYFTSNPTITADVADLFNALTGYSRKEAYDKLLVAPKRMRQELLLRIDREIACHQQAGGGHLAFKMNALVDKACIQALYRASQAGVQVDLQVRGICCLRPGIPGISEHIRVTSIVGRFLEHARIFYFRNGGDEELLLGSADLMPRNLDGRFEVLFPVEDPELKRHLRDQILFVHLRDNLRSRQLLPDGTYQRLRPAQGESPLDSQQWMLEHRGSWHNEL